MRANYQKGNPFPTLHDFSMRRFCLLHKPEFHYGNYARSTVGDIINAPCGNVDNVAGFNNFNSVPELSSVFKRVEDNGFYGLILPTVRDVDPATAKSRGHEIIIMDCRWLKKRKRYTLNITRHQHSALRLRSSPAD